jgi:hypothetical protein
MDDRNRFERRAPWLPWALTSLAFVAVAVIAYGVGANREAAAAATEPVRWRSSGFGGIWLFFLLFWIFGGLRWMWWGGYGYRRWHSGPYYPRHYDGRADWEEWHRREHERMNGGKEPGAPPASASTDRPIT